MRFPDFSQKELSNRFRKQLKEQSIMYRVLIVLNTALGIGVGILVNLATGATEYKSGRLYWTLVVLLGGVVLVFTALIAFAQQPITEFIVEFDNMNAQLNESKYVTEEYNKIQRAMSVAVRDTILNLISAEKGLLPTRDEAISKLLDVWAQDRAELFNFAGEFGEAMYNLGVYFQDEDGLLKSLPIHRRYDDRLHPSNRSWKSGDGQIGICFSTEATKFADDASTFDAVSEKAGLPTDKSNYRSIIAEPLRSGNKTVGVLVITSSEPYQFDRPVHVPIVRLMARLIERTIDYSNEGAIANGK